MRGRSCKVSIAYDQFNTMKRLARKCEPPHIVFGFLVGRIPSTYLSVV